jgi:outer membrane protein TolC
VLQRRESWFAIGVIVLTVLLSSSELRAGASEAASVLDCEEAVRLVTSEHPSVRAARAKTAEADAAASVLRWLDPPEVRLRTDAGTRDDERRVGLRWPLPAPGAARAKARAAEARRQEVAAEAALIGAKVAAQLRKEFATARHAREERRILEQLAQRAREHAETTEKLTEIGTVTALEREAVFLNAGEIEVKAARARSREEIALLAISQSIGGPATPSPAPCASAEETEIEASLGSHPETEAARQRVAAAAEESLIARREAWLWPSFIELTWAEAPDNNQDGVLLQAGIEVPVVGRTLGEAVHHERQRRLAFESVQHELRARAEAAAARYQTARREREGLEAMRSRAEGARDLAEQASEAGAAPSDLWRLEERLADWEMRLNDAQYDEELARIELRLALGLQ